MKISNELRKQINEGVRRICGAAPLAEVGTRESKHGGNWVANGLNWVKDADLGDLIKLRDLKEIDCCPDLPGAATMDLYVTSGVGFNRELERNVYVVIKDGKLADLHSDDLGADARTMAILGRPFSSESEWEGAK